MNTFLLYLILQLDNLLGVTATLAIISAFALFFYVIYFLGEEMFYEKKHNPEKYYKVTKVGKRILLTLILSTVLSIFIPTTEGGLTLYAADYMTHNKRITNLTHDSLDLIENWVEKQKKKNT